MLILPLMLLMLPGPGENLAQALSNASFLVHQKTPSPYLYIGNKDFQIQAYYQADEQQLDTLGQIRGFKLEDGTEIRQSGDYFIYSALEAGRQMFQIYLGVDMIARETIDPEPFSWVEYYDHHLYLGYQRDGTVEIRRYSLDQHRFDANYEYQFQKSLHFPVTGSKSLATSEGLLIWVRDAPEVVTLDYNLQFQGSFNFNLPYEILKFDHRYYSQIYRDILEDKDFEELKMFCEGLDGEPLFLYPWELIMLRGEPHLIFHMSLIQPYSESDVDCSFLKKSFLVNLKNNQFTTHISKLGEIDQIWGGLFEYLLYYNQSNGQWALEEI